jgi:DnaK suppressor protein
VEEGLFLEVIDAAEERAQTKTWKTCTKCGKPIGDARLEALPATDLCVVCKADRANW